LSLDGLANINIELTDRCQKNCWMCGRRKRERENPEIKSSYGNMDFNLVELISVQVPSGIIIQFHNNGEGLLYPWFGKTVKLFRKCITNIVTNGILLVEKANEIVENLDTISISIIENDDAWQEQLTTIEKFLELKGDKKPFTTLRFVGKIDESRYDHLDLLKVRRVLHDPTGSVNYKKKVTIPEHGICEDMLHHLAINKLGDVSLCVRFDPNRELVLGNIKEYSLDELWNSEKRLQIKKLHVQGKRKLVQYCGNKCDFYGVATSP
jgi:MoaA/NifB/PqqE/SkfB family radical SAM enzyme